MKICLLIINYNGFKFLASYLEDIANFCNKSNISLIITDDNSKDESTQFLKDKKYNYTINSGNKHGFAANVNHGIRYALEFDAFDYFIISNNDIEISEHIFIPLKMVLMSSRLNIKNLGLIGFKEVNRDQYSYFREFNFSSYDISSIKEVESIPGFFFIICKELINEIGYFDEEYYMYGEDNDYFARTLKANYKIINCFLPLMHYSEGSSTNDKLTSWYTYRNAFLFAQKNHGPLKIIKLFLSFVNIIYNPIYKNNSPSSLRIKRNGFFFNNFLLIKSLIWNLNYYFVRLFNKL